MGVAAAFEVAVVAANGALPLEFAPCPADATGACLAAATPAAVVPLAPGATATLKVFAAATAPVRSTPGGHAVFVSFADGAGVLRGRAVAMLQVY